MCVPALAASIAKPEDLADARCIADVGWNDWAVWTGAVMPGHKFVARGPGFSLYSIALQQALLAAGVLIGRRSLVQRYLDSGELVAPIDRAVPLGMTIAAWRLPGAKGNQVVAAVEEALLHLA
ncbi:Glycine cleavage system transcriptional activator [compost metagenome]